jgi:DNA polymerase-4
MQRLICHVDMNSYFASVEQQANPFLRGRAVGVCAYLHRKGCVIAASVEAKQRGMKVGMNMEEAMAVVPNAVFVQNDPPKYRAVTSKIFGILHEISDTIEHYSIDEAFLDLTGWHRDEAEAAFALSRVKNRITKEVGEWLRCSVGIAPTRFLAKFASERKKPDGLTIITPENLDETLATADLEDACGIGPRIRRRLERLHIHTLLELKRYPVGNLMRAFGKNGFYLWCKVNGIECERVVGDEPPPKSIGHSYCVPNRVNREGKVEAVLTKLTERAGRRLRAHGLLARGISVTVGLRNEREYLDDFRHFSEPADDSFTLVRQAIRILHELWNNEAIDFLAVTLVDLTIPSNQLAFPIGVMHQLHIQRWERIGAVSKSLDLIRDRYGEAAIVFGRMSKLMGSGDEAPDRIGFRKTGSLELASKTANPAISALAD